MISAVVFDFDGVLADTERLHLVAFQQVFATRGWELSDATYFDEYLGYDDIALVEAYARDRKLDLGHAELRTVANEKIKLFERHLVATDVMFPAARACVARLKPHFALAIASGALHAEIVHLLGVGGLLDEFAVIIGADDGDERKPLPGPYLAAAMALGVDPGTCVAVEDSPWGLTSAIAAGMCTIGVTTSYGSDALSSAHRIIASLEELTPELVASFGESPVV
jgi:beta-phosphoglucomutase